MLPMPRVHRLRSLSAVALSVGCWLLAISGAWAQIDFRAAMAPSRILKEEDPFCCIRCGKPFGVKSTIERISAKLAERHWMFQGAPERLEALKMCEDCRVIAITEQQFDPHAPPRPPVRTTDDFLREREAMRRKDET